MRLSALLLIVAMAGVVIGAALIGRWAVGIAVIADSALIGTVALLRDVPGKRPAETTTLAEVLERARRSA